jgi:TRAP-type mannitol/chloroaromatic compound transport system permease large subunit
MIAFITANMAPIMFASLVIFLLLGYPVAFALAANGIFFGLIGIELGLLQPSLFQALPERLWGVMSNDTLLAVPFFTFMGLIWSEAAWPRIFSTPSASSSGRCAAGSPSR